MNTFFLLYGNAVFQIQSLVKDAPTSKTLSIQYTDNRMYYVLKQVFIISFFVLFVFYANNNIVWSFRLAIGPPSWLSLKPNHLMTNSSTTSDRRLIQHISWISDERNMTRYLRSFVRNSVPTRIESTTLGLLIRCCLVWVITFL